MNRLPVDPEEMARRHDEDYIASLRMVGEGAPIFDSNVQRKQRNTSSRNKNYLRLTNN